MWRSILKRRLASLRSSINTKEVLQTQMRDHRLSDRKLPNNVQTCKFRLQVAEREIRRLEKDSFDTRLEEKITVAQIYDATGEKDRATLIREISRSEQTSETFRMFSRIRTNDQSGNITHVEIPTTWPATSNDQAEGQDFPDPKEHANHPESEWRRITQPDEINYFLRIRNRRHFGQAHGTPFTIPPLSYEIDWGASTLTAEAILAGDQQHNLPATITSMLKECKRRTTIADVSGHITINEFAAKFQKWRESTTTSPSGRHLGLYKALFRRHSLTNASEIVEFEQLKHSLIRTHVAVINYCLKFRYSLRRWKNIVNVMLLKKPGDYRIHRVRVIHIYEADFNFLLGIKWRQLLHNADAAQELHQSQYGGRPGCEATTLSLIEELKTDITYSSRKPLINFDNDATACYDRIITSLASLVSRSFGQDRNVCFVHATTLQEAKYRLKTATGISDEFYQHCSAYPIYGTGQGSGNSPVIWVLISSVLFSCHEKQAYGAIFESPDRSLRVSFSMIGFVDDSTGQVNAFMSDKCPTLDKLVTMMAHDAQLWNDLLHNSGGRLEITKCSYHILYFKFRRDGTPFMALGTDSPDLRVHDRHTKQDILVKRLMSFQSHETLGHFKSPSGNQSVHLKTITKTGVTLARQLYKSSATRAQALIFYWSIYVPSIRYTLPQSFFSHAQLHEAQAKSFPLILAKAGFLRTMPYSVVFGPTNLGGAGFVRWTTLQGEGQVMLFVKHWRAQDDAGKLLKIALSWAQFQAGTSRPLLQDVHRRLPQVESRWIPALRSFLATIGAKLVTDKTYIVPCQREGDEHIMDVIIEINEFTDKEIHMLNCCRLYLNVVTISDMTDASGINMDAMIANHLPSYSSHSKLHAPVQERPATWELWDVVMQRWFTSDNKLRRPLGKWLASGNRLRRTWLFYYDSSDQCVYQRVVDGFVRYARTSRGYGLQEITAWVPTSTSVPITVKNVTQRSLICAEIPQVSLSIPSPPPPAEFAGFIQTLPPWERALLELVKFLVPPFEFFTRFQQPTQSSDLPILPASETYLQCVSDGSNTRESMSYGWTFATNTGTRIAECSGPGYGPGTSHRAEAYGVLSAAIFVTRLQQFLQIHDPWPVTFISDNLGLITRLQNRQSYIYIYANSTLAPDWDLVEQIHMTLKSTQLRPTFAHVKGHQDEDTAYNELPLEAQMNVEADWLAGTYNEFSSAENTVPMLPVTGANLQIQTKTITSRYSRHIRQAAGEADYVEYLSHRRHWDANIWARIDKVILRRVIARHSHCYVNVVKLLHDYLPTSKIRTYSDPTQTHYCELCHAPNSTFAHVLRCPHPEPSRWREQLLREIREQCENTTTRLGIMKAVLEGLRNWFGDPRVDGTSYSNDIQRAIQDQNKIGWHSFLQGFCSSSWAAIQHSHLQHNELVTKTRTGATWLVSLVTIIWKHVFQLWETYKTLVHGADQKAIRHHAIRRIQTKIRLLHARATHIRAADQVWLIPNLDSYLTTATLAQLQRWYSTYEPVILAAIQISRDASTANTRSIRSYFPTTRAPRQAVPQAAHLNHRSSRVKTARTHAKSRQHTPRPRSNITIRRYFKPFTSTKARSSTPNSISDESSLGSTSS